MTMYPIEPFGPQHHYPFLLEIRDTSEDALVRYAELESAAARWLAIHGRENAAPSEWRGMNEQMSEEQSAIFRALEAFLASFSRVSLLIYPAMPRNRKRHQDADIVYRKARGACMRYLLARPPIDPINDVDLRHSWAHFDERMDAADLGVKMFGRQGWGHSRHTSSQTVEAFVRYVEVDTLRVLFRDEKGNKRSTELAPLVAAIGQVFALLSTDRVGDQWDSNLIGRLNATSGNPCR